MKRTTFIETISLLTKGVKSKKLAIPILENFLFSESHLIYFDNISTKMVEIKEAFSDRAFLLPFEIAKTIVKYKGYNEIEFDAEGDSVKIILDGQVKMKYDKLNISEYPEIPNINHVGVLMTVNLLPHVMAIAQKMVQFCAKEPINKVNLNGLVVDAKKIIATNSEVLAFHNFNLVDLYEHQGTLPFVKRKIPQFLIPNYALELLPSSTVKPFTVTILNGENGLIMIVSANGLKVVFPVEKTEFNFSKVLEKTSKTSIIINTRDAENKIKTAISVSKYAKVSFDASKPSQIDFSCINPDSLVDFTFSLPVFSYHPKNLKTITGGLSLEDFLKIIKWENETYLKVYFNNLKFYFENSLLTCKTVQDVNSIFIEYTSIDENPNQYPVVPSEAIEQKVESTTQKEAIEKDIVVSDLKEEPTSLIEEEIPVQEYVAESSDSLIDENEWLNAVSTESSDKIQPNNNFYEETTSSNNNV